MSWWRVRNPGSFPPDYHRAMKQGPGVDKIVVVRHTKQAAESVQRDWRVFRLSLRNHPADPAAWYETHFDHRTRIAYNHETGVWEFLLTTRERAFEDIESVE